LKKLLTLFLEAYLETELLSKL